MTGPTNHALLEQLFPFHFRIDRDGRVTHLGPALRGLIPEAASMLLIDAIDDHSASFDLDAGPTEQWVGRLVRLRFAYPNFGIRGEFIDLGDDGFVFAGALEPQDAKRLGELGLTAATFPSTDLTMEFAMLQWSRDSQVRETKLALLRLRESITHGESMRLKADTDALTGIANRSRFVDVVEELIRNSPLDTTTLSVMMIDIDRFKAINDLNGHLIGDQTLVTVARHLSRVVGDRGLVARIGGDEFAVVVSDADVRPVVRGLTEEIVALNHEPIAVGDCVLNVTISLGVAYHTALMSASDLLRHADVAMYNSRLLDDSAVAVFDPAAGRELDLRRIVSEQLVDAIRADEIELYFQPIVDLKTREAVKYEVLSRWTHPDHGPIPPTLFVQVAEQCQLVQELDRYVIDRSMRIAKRDLATDGEVARLSINVSALSLTDDLTSYLRWALDEFEFSASKLTIEVTETSSITDLDRTSRVLHDLHDLGIVVSLDDFGTGYSSLTHLHHLPIDALKIDRSFVADMLESRKALELVRSIIQVARSLELPVVAEGVETIEQCVLLQNLGCDQAQGYYFSRPAGAPEISATLGMQLPRRAGQIDADAVEASLWVSQTPVF